MREFIKIRLKSGLDAYHMGKLKISGGFAYVMGRSRTWIYPKCSIVCIEIAPARKERR